MQEFTHFIFKNQQDEYGTHVVDRLRERDVMILGLCLSLINCNTKIWAWKNDPCRITAQMAPGELDVFLLRRQSPLTDFVITTSLDPNPLFSTLAYPLLMLEIKDYLNKSYGALGATTC